MPVFRYRVKTAPSAHQEGTLVAEDQRAAVRKLLEQQLHPVSIVQLEDGGASSGFAAKISMRDLYLFFRQLANLSIAGLPLSSSLGNISEQSGNIRLKHVAAGLREMLQRGSTLSEALEQYAGIFSPLEISMVRAAETTGTLPEVLMDIANLKEHDLAFAQKIRAALAYPALLAIVGSLTLFVLSSFVLPKFVGLFNDLDQELPLLTQALVSGSLFLERYWPAVLGGIVLFLAGIWQSRQTVSGKRLGDRIVLRMPGVGTVAHGIQTARFARTLSNLLQHGVAMLSALNISAELMTNVFFSDALKNAHAKVAEGFTLKEALARQSLFDRNTLDLIAIGEESGRLDEMLRRVAELHEQETAQRTETVLLLLEPILILFFGGVVAVIVIAILLPILQMNFLMQ